jgi:hypothetical protein
MNLALGILLALLLLTGGGVTASADCAVSAAPKLSVDFVDSPAKENRTQSVAAMTKESPKTKRPGLEGYDHTLGRTATDLRAELHYAMTIEHKANRVCISLDSATVTLRLETVVYIASEITPGSCMDTEVKKHEQRHVAAERALMPKLRTMFEQALAPLAAGPIDGATEAKAEAAFERRARAAMDDTLAAFSPIEDQQQFAIDTPEEYARLPKTCGRDAYNKLMQH